MMRSKKTKKYTKAKNLFIDCDKKKHYNLIKYIQNDKIAIILQLLKSEEGNNFEKNIIFCDCLVDIACVIVCVFC